MGMVTQHRGNLFNPLNCILKNGENGKLYVTCILPEFLGKVGGWVGELEKGGCLGAGKGFSRCRGPPDLSACCGPPGWTR